MLGLSYGEIFLILGATAALIGTITLFRFLILGPKDLPIISRTAGRLAGRAIGYVQVARGQFENVMQQTQFRQVNKELQDTMAQLEAIRHEIRSFSIMNPGPLTRSLMGDPDQPNAEAEGNAVPLHASEDKKPATTKTLPQPQQQQRSPNTGYCSTNSGSADLHSRATAYARLVESRAVKAASSDMHVVDDKPGLLSVLPISAESAGLLPNRQGEISSTDIVLEAILEAEVAKTAKEFFSQQQNQIKFE